MQEKRINFYTLFWLFFIASIIGFVHENIWTILKNGQPKLQQGLIYGPFIPIYGLGALLFVLFLQKVKKTSYIFFYGALIGGFFEYCMSVFEQYVFGSVSWNYNHIPLNINGRTNLFYSLFWGLACVFLLKFFYPTVINTVSKLPQKKVRFLATILALFIFFDCTVSALAVYRMSERNQKKEAVTAIDVFFDTYYPDAVLKPIFTNLEFVSKNK